MASLATPPVNTEMDLSKSLVLIFPAVTAENGMWYYFYVQLKDTNGHYMDCNPADISLKTNKGKKVSFKFERLLTGRYYLTLEKTTDTNSGMLDFFIGNKPLKEQFKLKMRMPDKAHSKITILRNNQNRITFRLRLADKTNHAVDIPEKPEILLDGQGNIEDLALIKDGVWEFSVIYPDENQIMYFSVRAQGVYLQNLFRYQHVEK